MRSRGRRESVGGGKAVLLLEVSQASPAALQITVRSAKFGNTIQYFSLNRTLRPRSELIGVIQGKSQIFIVRIVQNICIQSV